MKATVKKSPIYGTGSTKTGFFVDHNPYPRSRKVHEELYQPKISRKGSFEEISISAENIFFTLTHRLSKGFRSEIYNEITLMSL